MAASEERLRARMAEARRNRGKLIAAATEAFAAGSRPVHLEAIARAAGVGIGTLYRHFPTRAALVEAVYLDQVDRLQTAARVLLDEHPPDVAFRMWTSSFLDWAATKHGMGETLREVVDKEAPVAGDMRSRLVALVSDFLGAGARSGSFRADVDASDVAGLLAGVLIVAGAQRPHAERMLQIIAEGIRDPAAGAVE
jgi:AcrR family transcriptional regulator